MCNPGSRKRVIRIFLSCKCLTYYLCFRLRNEKNEAISSYFYTVVGVDACRGTEDADIRGMPEIRH